MPQTVSAGGSAFADYIKIASLPKDERLTAFGKLSNEQKAGFVKIQLALHLVKRPNLTKEQRNFISDAVSKVSADLYDKENPQKVALANQINQEMENKAFGLFQQKDAFQILEGLGSNKNEDVALLKNYEDLLKFGMEHRKILAKEMPLSERVAIWKTQMAYHLATSSLNTQQKEFIAEFIPNIQSVFEASINLTGDEKDKYLDTLEASIFKVFTKAEAYAVFMTIGIQNIVSDNPPPTLSNFLAPQTIKLGFSGNLLLSPIGENKSFKVLPAPNLQFYSCNCRWYCDIEGQVCNNSYCNPVDRCGPLDNWSCTSRCTRDYQ